MSRPRGTVRLRPVPDRQPRALGLVRVSKERVEMISPELQRAAITDYAARRGYEIVDWLEGIDESASRTRSSWWRRLDDGVAMVEAGRVDVVLVWKFSRAARNRLRWATAVDRVEVAGGRLESATEQVDVTTSTGRFTRGMLAELNAFESERIGEQWKEAQARRLRLGLPHTGGPRFGYIYDKTSGYVPDPDTAPILDDLYVRYVAGEGFQTLAVSLNREGVRTLRGGAWTATTLMRQLDSGFAAGFLQTGVRKGNPVRVRGAHPAVITERTWEAYLRRREQQRSWAPREKHPTYPLTGLVRHDCGAALAAWSKPDRRGVVQRGYLYRCVGWVQGTCSGVWVKRETVEQLVLDEVRGWVGDVDARAATKTARTAARVVAKADVARLRREQQKVEKALTQLTVQVASGLVPESAYATARDELLGQQAALEQQVAAARGDEERLGTDLTQLQGVLREWDTLPAADQRDVLSRFVRRVTVSKDSGVLRVVVESVTGGVL